ncbi:FecR domain-containing protein [Chitinophaga sancti]|uniref:FecR family protein n=1 Tax=Chitinophaga sancti TaxID=1004 RepID=UPI002A761083|nr:FecR domain-containing protein [Chitinophaga sancti]WPQ66182.1 FecR domain-containing protein [Chitinophaga sancti]
MQIDELEILVHKYLNGTATQSEIQLLNQWYQQEQLVNKVWEADSLDEERVIKTEIFEVIRNRTGIQPNRQPVRRLWFPLTAAASVLLLFCVGFYFYMPDKKAGPQEASLLHNDALPGSNGAILTLANGQKIQLGEGGTIKPDIEHTDRIKKYGDSIVVYSSSNKCQMSSTAYNTITTPNGKQFHIVLPDGTKVFMNAASSLQYPVVFSGSERVVKLTGEAYFEVVHNSRMPFKVQVDKQVVEDIGTEFNINSYNDNGAIAVTVLEGSAKVQVNKNAVTLTPGQQALTETGNDQIKVQSADTESVLAWKNGLFHFNNASIDLVLKQLARWYDLEVIYEGSIPKKTIDGEIYRDVKFSEVFMILKALQINYRIEGRKVIIKAA